MKKLFKTFALVLFTTSVFAQQREHRYDDDRQENYDQRNDYNDTQNRNHAKNRKSNNIFSKKDFGLLIGLNSYDAAIDMPELNTWQSRYVALQWRKNHKLITGRQVDVALGTGLEVSWNNFMMQHDEQFYEIDDITDFELLDYSVEKSKLVVNNLNLPVMLQFGFKESDFRLGIGAYGGVRINSYQKTKEFEDVKYKEKGEYNLRKFNYGLMAEAGRGDVRVFAKYDMQPLFNDNNPINANVLTIGLRL